MKTKSKSTKKWKAGVKINFLTIQKIYKNEKGVVKATCKCDCGKIKEFYLSNIQPKKNSRYTVSCGCKRAEIMSKKVSVHSMSKTRFYKTWRSMFNRMSPKYINASSYKGLYVSSDWNNFLNFKRDMFVSYEKHVHKYGIKNTTLDRINVHDGYTKENCRWATTEEQAFNKKNTHFVNYNGKNVPLKLLCKDLGVMYGTVYSRMHKFGMTIEQALTKKPWIRL